MLDNFSGIGTAIRFDFKQIKTRRDAADINRRTWVFEIQYGLTKVVMYRDGIDLGILKV